MINISGHLRNTRRVIGFYDDTVPLLVNCCGKQVFQTQDYNCNREHGRLDYQIIYVYKGIGHFYLDGRWTTLTAGNLVLYRPSEPQFYAYYAHEKPEIYWLHFTGNQCDRILEQYSIKNCYIGENLSIKLLFQDMITELQLKKLHYEDIVLNQLYILFACIHRSSHQTLRSAENDFSIDRLLIEMNQNYARNWDVPTMADYCKLGNSYFAHTFKQRMGLSPMQYLNHLRIEKAKDLLTGNSLSVAAVARLVGYDDPLYFSRVFKKFTGIPPQSFSQAISSNNTPGWFFET